MIKICRYYQRIRWLFDDIRLRWTDERTYLPQVKQGNCFLEQDIRNTQLHKRKSSDQTTNISVALSSELYCEKLMGNGALEAS